jgi:glucose-1-phosphate adenylyltransferase
VNSYAQVSDSILFDRVEVGRHAKIRRAIIDKDVRIPPGVSIGYDLELDKRRGFVVSPEGIVVVGKEDAVDPLPVPIQI